MRGLPRGTVTLMFTDIEGSTRLLQQLGDRAYTGVLERHHQLIREVLAANEGTEVATEGDSFFAAFTDAVSAAAAAVEITRGMQAEPWHDGVEVLVRIGLHTGTPVVGGDNYVGVDVHRAARISAAGHGGQILISATTAAMVRDRLPGGTMIGEPETVHLADLASSEQLNQLLVEGGRRTFPPLRGTTSPSRLPAQLTEFFGREDELADGEVSLMDHRLVTLTGPGGTGKTRLAIELARQVEPRFPDGAFFVSLASTNDAEMVPSAILETIGLHTAPTVNPADHLFAYLRDRAVLLVLDNLEQLPKVGGVIARLLGEAPDVRVLATSRARLQVRGEHELAVPPLPVPAVGSADLDSYAGTRLLVDRAVTARPGFELTDENRAAVAAIASHLDGLPLAIELAASRMRALTPELILERLDNRLLSAGNSDLPERQQTIVNTIGWSYDLLHEADKILFERCSVFSGTFGLDQAEEVCGGDGVDDVLGGLISLTESSLLQQVDEIGQARFRMLVVIREFAYAGLVTRGEDRPIASRHAGAYLALAEKAEAEILTSRQGYWLDRLSADHDNLRTGIDWAIDSGEADLALNLVGKLWRFWQFRGHLIDAQQRISKALALVDGSPRARARALTAQGGVLYWRGDWSATLDPYAEALEIMRAHGEQHEVAEALYNLSFPTGYSGDTDGAEAMLWEAHAIYKRLGDRVGVGRCYWGLGDNEGYRENWHGLLEHLGTAQSILEGEDAPFDVGWTLFMQGWANLRLRNYDEAIRPTQQALEIFADVGDVSALVLVLESLALGALHIGDPILAARLHGASNGLRAETGVSIQDVDINRYPDLDELTIGDDEITAAAYAEGLVLGLDESIDLARQTGL